MSQTVLACAMIFLVLPGFAPGNESTGSVDALVAAEQAFCRLTLAKGMHEGFLANFATDGIVLRPQPVLARPVYEKVPADSPAQLSWQPDYAEISAAGDLGFTAGPWDYRKTAADPEPSAYGHYVSIWRKQADGHWKLQVDCGIDHPRPEGPPAAVSTHRLPPGAAPAARKGEDAETLKAGLMRAERNFQRLVQVNGGAAAFAAVAAGDVRLYRSNEFPFVDSATAGEHLKKNPPAATWKPQAAGVSSSGDLGYTYGETWAAAGGSYKPTGSYLRIWRRENGGKWKIALDLNLAYPPEAAKAK